MWSQHGRWGAHSSSYKEVTKSKSMSGLGTLVPIGHVPFVRERGHTGTQCALQGPSQVTVDPVLLVPLGLQPGPPCVVRTRPPQSSRCCRSGGGPRWCTSNSSPGTLLPALSLPAVDLHYCSRLGHITMAHEGQGPGARTCLGPLEGRRGPSCLSVLQVRHYGSVPAAPGSRIMCPFPHRLRKSVLPQVSFTGNLSLLVPCPPPPTSPAPRSSGTRE